jgi:hypothetical protein
MRTRLPLLLILALASVLGCGGPEAQASARFSPTSKLPPSTFTVTLDDGGTKHSYRGADYFTTSGTVNTPVIETRTSGTLRIQFELASGDTPISEGEVLLPLRKDWIWGASIMVDSLNPTRYCFGCVGSKAFPLAAAYRRVPQDSVWMTWGGNSIKNPVVY